MENQGEIVLYQLDKEVKLEVRLENETVWLSIDEMSQLFGRDISVIGKHIRNIFKEGELVKDSVWAKFAYTASDGKVYQVDYYNLDVIISVGYRVKSYRGTQFRQWANNVLKNHLLKGYSVNQRLRNLEERVDAKLLQHEKQLDYLTGKVDFFVRTSLPPVEGIFYDGQIFDAYKFAADLIRTAKKSILLIDNYVDDSVLRIGDNLLKSDSGSSFTVSKAGTLVGVYNINKGYADFKQIQVLNQNEEYSIVKSNTSYGLIAYDHIVLDAESVNEDEFIYQ